MGVVDTRGAVNRMMRKLDLKKLVKSSKKAMAAAVLNIKKSKMGPKSKSPCSKCKNGGAKKRMRKAVRKARRAKRKAKRAQKKSKKKAKKQAKKAAKKAKKAAKKTKKKAKKMLK